jgi:hypothetical protein
MLVSFAILTILTPSLLINTSQAQPTQPQQPIQSKPPLSLSPTPSSLSSKIHAVKITSPTKSQQVTIGKDLTITGTSLANASSNCQVCLKFSTWSLRVLAGSLMENKVVDRISHTEMVDRLTK